jgi:hypothetical protein
MAEALRRRSILALIVVVATVAAVVLLVARPWEAEAPPIDMTRGGPDAADMADNNPEKEEQEEQAEERREAFERAVEAGKAGKEVRVVAAAAPGWAGEQLVDSFADDWEPAIAADPSAPFVYLLTTRYGTTKPCPGNCPDPWIALEISSDGGATWTDGVPLCACKGGGQFDPIIEVVPGTGEVYATYMSGYNVMFVKSSNHGSTWTAPVKVYGNVSWNDKPVLAVSDNGRDVYIPFNGPTGGDPWLAQSHDFGVTWAQAKLVNSNRYYFAFDADVAADGTVYLGQSSILYGGGGNKGTTPSAAIDEHVFVSTTTGATFTDRLVASVQPGIACTAAGCSPDFYLGHHALTVDATGRVVFLYDGAASSGGLQTISSRTSTNRGASWTAAVQLSATGSEATLPAIESRGTGDVRAWYAQTTGSNVDQWNVYYRSSTDGGLTWSAAVDISDATSGAAYQTAAGFLEVYGDYGEIAITSAGKTIAVWGEGFSWTGPGGAWFNRQP